MLPGTGGSNVYAALIVGNGGHTKVLLIFFNTGAVFANELMMSLTRVLEVMVVLKCHWLHIFFTQSLAIQKQEPWLQG